jgi:hypothetical protein
MRARASLAAAWIGLAVAVAAPAALAQTPTEDSVTGSATDCDDFVSELCFHPTSVKLDARSGPNGENPGGTAEWETVIGSNASLGDGGPVSCLAVSGSTAIIGFRSGLNTRSLIRVTDGGNSPGQDSFAAVTDASLFAGAVLPAPDCSSFPPSPVGEVRFPQRSGVNELGNIVVVDSAALPTTKDQCKNGGWRSYPGFKNQGDCVSFVATGGKNPPGN